MAKPKPAPQPWPPEGRATVTPITPRKDRSSDDALLAFRSEAKVDSEAKRDPVKPPARAARPWSRIAAIAGAVLVLGAVTTAGLYSATFLQASRLPAAPAQPVAAPAPPEGTLTVNSRPEGARISIDGVLRGVTPVKLALAVGDHTLDLQNGSATRSIPVTIQAGVVLSQYVDIPPGAAAPAVGRLEITSDPSGARVTVDGAARGVTPVTLANVVPGTHAVAIFGEDSTVTRTVTVAAGSTAAVTASLLPAGASAGWVVFKVPFEMQLMEDGKRLGTTGLDRLMLPAGRHDLVLSNAAFEFESPLTVQVAAGKTTTPVVPIPMGTLSINATPWADVTIDGQFVGTTPLANLSLTVGTHEIVCRHPQLGEQRQTVTVKAKSPARVGISFK